MSWTAKTSPKTNQASSFRGLPCSRPAIRSVVYIDMEYIHRSRD